MSNWKNYTVACLLSLSMIGCATAPATYSVERSRAVDISYDEAWERVIKFFAQQDLPIKTIEKDSGIVYSETMNIPSSFMDCGSAALMHSLYNNGAFNVFVTRFSGENVRVNINTKFSVTRAFGGNPPIIVACNSTGALENSFYKYISR